MATISITVTTGGQDLGRSKEISGAHLVRFADALLQQQGQVPDGADPPGLRDKTNAEVFDAWAAWVFQQAKNLTRAVELDMALAAADVAARDGVLDIDLI